MTRERLKEILINHRKWLNNEDGGIQANLRFADLRGADLQDADLRHTYLQCAKLRDTNLRDANLQCAKLRDADLRYVNLQSANLRFADLRGANLQDADLRYAIGNNREIKTFQFGTYIVVHYLDILQIGCKKYTKDEWWNFTDEEISEMDEGALEWWKIWKPILQQICENLEK